MRLAIMLVLVSIVNLIGLVWAFTLSDPLPVVILALMLWPILMLIVVVINSAVPSRVNMLEMQNYYNVSAIRQDIERK